MSVGVSSEVGKEGSEQLCCPSGAVHDVACTWTPGSHPHVSTQQVFSPPEDHAPVGEMSHVHRHWLTGACGQCSSRYRISGGSTAVKWDFSYPPPASDEENVCRYQVVPELSQTPNQKTVRSSEDAPWPLSCDLFSFRGHCPSSLPATPCPLPASLCGNCSGLERSSFDLTK